MLFETSWLIGLHIPPDLMPSGLMWLTNILFLVALVLAASKAPVRGLLDNRPSQHVYFGAMVVLLLLWGLKAGITPGLGFHHLGATIFTLMFGWPLAIFGLTTVLMLSLILQKGTAGFLPIDEMLLQLSSLGINGLFSIVVPVWVSWAVLKFSHRKLPDNFFIYIFVVAFFGAGIAVAASRLVAILVFWLANVYPDNTLVSQSLLMLPLFMFPEAFITGMLISIFVVYKPSWVITFDDERYLVGK
jgi:uncharacterized membrane protein